MNPDHVHDFMAILARNSIRSVIVGGAAVRRSYPSESQDVDALVMTKQYGAAVRALDKDPSVVSFSHERNQMATGHFHTRYRLVRFDLLDPTAFAGTSAGDDFFDYVARHGSVLTEDGRMAKVAVVWYMRLVIEGDSWTAQVGKILRDLRAGVPWETTSGVRRIARRFGVGQRVDQRLLTVEDAARLAGLLPSKGRTSV